MGSGRVSGRTCFLNIICPLKCYLLGIHTNVLFASVLLYPKGIRYEGNLVIQFFYEIFWLFYLRLIMIWAYKKVIEFLMGK